MTKPQMRQTRIGAGLAALLAAMALLAGCAGVSLSSADLGKTRQTALGAVLVDEHGSTLYTYDPDSPGSSHCTGTCAAVWPPAKADAAATPNGSFTIIARPDGSRQWAYRGKPLYGYLFDKGPGSVSGDGVDGIWHAAKP